MRAREMAAKKGLEVLWSNVNQAWLIISAGMPNIQPRLVGVKTTVEEVLDYLED